MKIDIQVYIRRSRVKLPILGTALSYPFSELKQTSCRRSQVILCYIISSPPDKTTGLSLSQEAIVITQISRTYTCILALLNTGIKKPHPPCIV